MKNLKKFWSIFTGVMTLVIMGAIAPGYAMATGENGTTGAATGASDGSSVAQLSGDGGTVVEGARTMTGDQNVVKDSEWFIKQVNQKIVEMKFTGTPIDQILRHAGYNKSKSIVVKYYSVGQRPLLAELKETCTSNTNGNAKAVSLTSGNVIGTMDTLIVMDPDGNLVPGYIDGTTATDPNHPLMLRVSGVSDTSNQPYIYAVNGMAADHGNFKFPNLAQGSKLLRMGRAAAEKDVSTGRYYSLPTPTEQYCQRFIMEVEESIYTRLSETEVDWNFSSIERMAVDDMRIGMEASGLFGVKSMHTYNGQGIIYTTEGIWYKAGKDLELGSWVDTGKTHGENKIYEYKIDENDLVDFVAEVVEDSANASRKRMVFVDKDIYTALCKMTLNQRVRILEKTDNYMNLGLDFESYSSMGTTLMFYRYDLFNQWGFSKIAFVLDPNYLDKWVFSDWSRTEYNLKDLFIRNANAVTMEEFSCWTLSYPNAHARVAAPDLPAGGESYQEHKAHAA